MDNHLIRGSGEQLGALPMSITSSREIRAGVHGQGSPCPWWFIITVMPKIVAGGTEISPAFIQGLFWPRFSNKAGT